MQTPTGELTIFGVFTIYQEEIATNWGWNELTLAQYRASLQNIIIPCIEDHNTRPIDLYTPEFISSVVTRIAELGHQKYPGKGYERETLIRFRHILNVTVYTAILHLLCPDVWKKTNDILRKRKSEKRTPIRFFSPADDLRIIQYIKENLFSSGEMRGLYIMMCTRCRENEAAGLTWGNIRDNKEDPRLLTVHLLETTKLDSNENKIGGKTENAPREITLTLEQSEFVRKMQRSLEEKWEKKGGDLSAFNRLRVAAKKNLWGACRSRDLSEAANKMFAELGLSDMIATLSRQLAQNAIAYAENPDFWETPPETSATCYSLRRAAASFDRVLGIDMEDRKYLMGHVVSGTTYAHCFKDAKHQCELAEKSADRPGLNTICSQVSTLERTLEVQGAYCDTILVSSNNGRIVGMICTEEPGDQVHLKVSSTVPCKLTVSSDFLDPHKEYSWKINVKRDLHEQYERAEGG